MFVYFAFLYSPGSLFLSSSCVTRLTGSSPPTGTSSKRKEGWIQEKKRVMTREKGEWKYRGGQVDIFAPVGWGEGVLHAARKLG
jgi:hypothetical protein